MTIPTSPLGHDSPAAQAVNRARDELRRLRDGRVMVNTEFAAAADARIAAAEQALAAATRERDAEAVRTAARVKRLMTHDAKVQRRRHDERLRHATKFARDQSVKERERPLTSAQKLAGAHFGPGVVFDTPDPSTFDDGGETA